MNEEAELLSDYTSQNSETRNRRVEEIIERAKKETRNRINKAEGLCLADSIILALKELGEDLKEDDEYFIRGRRAFRSYEEVVAFAALSEKDQLTKRAENELEYVNEMVNKHGYSAETAQFESLAQAPNSSTALQKVIILTRCPDGRNHAFFLRDDQRSRTLINNVGLVEADKERGIDRVLGVEDTESGMRDLLSNWGYNSFIIRGQETDVK